MKKTLILILMLALVFSFANSLAAEDNDFHVGWVTYTLEVDYFQSSVSGARRAAEEYGVELTVLDPRAEEERQVDQIEDLIAMGVDAIVVDAIDADTVLGPVSDAIDAGIVVVAVDTDIDHPDIVSTVATPNEDRSREFGRHIAGWIHAKYDGEAKIGIIFASSTIQLQRRDGFLDALKAIPNSEVVAEGDGRNIYEQSQNEAEDMITANPDIDVIYATGDPALMGAIAAAEIFGVEDEIDFFGWDNIPDHFIEPVQQGLITGFVNQMPDEKAAMAFEQVMKALRGEATERYLDAPIEIVTRFNIDQYID